ncbi:hypothetical protein ACHAW6_002072 [Cyclotella cf. meneghiniana]
MSCLHPMRRSGWQLTTFKSDWISHVNSTLRVVSNKGPPIRYRHHSQSQRIRDITPTSNHQRRGGGSPPSYIIFGFIAPAAGLTISCIYAYNSCLDYVPYTHRKRLIATSPEWEARLGHEQYRAYLKSFGDDVLPKDHRASVTVERVGSRIAAAAQAFTREHNVVNSINSSPFTYTVVRSDDANAFVLPGNHVFVLTGLFKYAHNEDELASILGHETAHNLARHAGERVSQNLITKILGHLALLIDPSGLLFSIFVPAEALFYSLPHSREHEVEADRIGLILASEACYDPRAAKNVFARMKYDADSGDRNTIAPPEFVSTHPGYETRLSNFDEWMPGAMERFNRDDGKKCFAIRQEMKRARSMAAKMHDGRERVDGLR